MVVGLFALTAPAQVHHHPDGHPWKQRANRGPDAEVPGWYYNLGPTGLRVELVDAAPTELVVRYVFPGSVAAGHVLPGDRIVGAGGEAFVVPHQNGYGMEVFGARGPISDFALRLDEAASARGKLALALVRGDERLDVNLALGAKHDAFSPSFPADCEKSERLLAGLLEQLMAQQAENGSWGSPPRDTFAPLALLASGTPEHLAAVERNARWHARSTNVEGDTDLVNWRYMAAAIVLSEYHLATGAEWVKPELEEIYAFLISSQYTDLAQLNPRVHESHPDAVPRDALDSHGGWGHNPGFEGYGPIAMLTGQGALAFALMGRCGVEIDPGRHAAAYAFLARATGRNGYVWYEDQVAGHDDWADLGRTGAAALANLMGGEAELAERGRAQATAIGRFPESFPDTHGSPILGMGYVALAAGLFDALEAEAKGVGADDEAEGGVAPGLGPVGMRPGAFRSLMDSNRWWFTLAECQDGSFYYQPNRDNAGYGPDSRLSPSAAVALILSIPKGNLVVTGRRP